MKYEGMKFDSVHVVCVFLNPREEICTEVQMDSCAQTQTHTYTQPLVRSV